MDDLEPETQTSQTPAPRPNGSKSAFVVGGLIVLLILGLSVYLLRQNNPKQSIAEEMTSPSATPNESVSTGSAELLAGGNSYLDKNDVYTILYPTDFQMDTQNNGQQVRFFKQGPTQKGQTEMYDGVMLVIETFELKEDQTLDEWVNERLNQQTSGGEQIVVSPQKLKIANYPSFKYRMRGLGEFDNYAIQRDNDPKYVVYITTLVADPTNQNFQMTVDDILSTIRMVK